MSGVEVTADVAGNVAGNGDLSTVHTHLQLVQDIVRFSSCGFSGPFKKDCTDLARRISLLAHLLEEIREFKGDMGNSSSSVPFLFDIYLALEAAKRLLLAAKKSNNNNSFDGSNNKLLFQFQCVTWKLERALTDIPLEYLNISEEVQEQVGLVRSQLRRAADRYGGPLNPNLLSRGLSQPLDKDIDPLQFGNRVIRSLHVNNSSYTDPQLREKSGFLPNMNGLDYMNRESSDADAMDSSANIGVEEIKKSDCTVVPDDLKCPISLELMRDPVIVSTGQTYERSYIQRWIDCGNTTCPKTQQKLEKLTLTPNYVLRSIISQWCEKHKIDQPTTLTNGKIRKSDGSLHDISSEVAAIEILVHKLSSAMIEESRAAVADIRSLSKRSTDNRILIAEAGAIPILVNLLTSEDVETQENAVTSILNLSIYENNKNLIMLAGAVPSIIQVLRSGTMEARENAAATVFSLSLADENKIIIGASGAIPALVKLLKNGSSRGRKDAATALFNLCIYQGNKGRAIRAGIVTTLLTMLTDSSSGMIDEALTVLSVLANHHDAKAAIVKASAIPILIDLIRAGLPRSKENAASILLSSCKRDQENLACLSRLGAVIPLTELARNGTERAKRKAQSLLEQLRHSQHL